MNKTNWQARRHASGVERNISGVEEFKISYSTNFEAIPLLENSWALRGDNIALLHEANKQYLEWIATNTMT